MHPSAVSTALDAHLEKFWPGRTKEAFEWSGPVNESVKGFRALQITPSTPKEPWIYASRGSWQTTHPGTGRHEFFIMAPARDLIHIETLAMIANFNADPKYSIHVGHVIDIGRPWVDEGTCDHLLVSLPYLVGPEFEKCRVGGLIIEWLWLLPITQAEAAYARAKGYEQLEDRFEDAAVDVVASRRRSVV